MENLIVLENSLEGLFIVPEQNSQWFAKESNIPVNRSDVLNEFVNAQFMVLNSFVERAETVNFLFFRYEEDKEDGIIWVQDKNAICAEEL